MTKKYIFSAILLGCAAAFTACEDDLDPNSIFEEVSDELDPNSASYQLDKFLEDNYRAVYNLQFRYKMQDVGTDMNYNLIPATYANSVDLAVMTKFLWFDVYDKVVTSDPAFLKKYGPRIIHLIGSPAYNPANGTMILGLAEGGLKVSLFRVNEMDVTDFYTLNEFYFRTMHHEFAHILHQTKTYPQAFNQISTQFYDPMGWQDRNFDYCYSLGFTSDYASGQAREDFAETIANYITRTSSEFLPANPDGTKPMGQWEEMMDHAGRGWEQLIDEYGMPVTDEGSRKPVYACYYYYKDNIVSDENRTHATLDEVTETRDADGNVVSVTLNSNPNLTVYPVEDIDGVDGPAVIEQKVQIARDWFRDAWGIDLDELRAEVQRRQLSINEPWDANDPTGPTVLEHLRSQVYDIPAGENAMK